MDLCHQLRTGGWKADYPLLIVAWPVLVSQKTVSISALMGCCCAGLGMRHSPPRLARLARVRCSLSDILGCSVPGLPGQSCLLPGRGGGDLCQQDGYLGQAALPGRARLTLV